MIAVVQRVSEASVKINDKICGEISRGFMILLGIANEDEIADIDWLANKIIGLRVFGDADSKMNLNIHEIDGNILLISQFTLLASTKKGNRPSFMAAAKPDLAIPIYEKFIVKLETLLRKKIALGQFGADMKVSLINDGPVTIVIDTANKK